MELIIVDSNSLRDAFLNFYKERGHVILPSASLVPEKDPTTLFTGSGMQPLIPYLLGAPHPGGSRLANSQKCFRAEDIERVGDNRHTTFFEMLGNWSLGDYFKREQLEWFFYFLTEILKLNPKRLYATVFAGDPENGISRDKESAQILKGLFSKKGLKALEADLSNREHWGGADVSDSRIFYYGPEKNWWSRAGKPQDMPPGEPGGPDSEIFYEFPDIPHNPVLGKKCHPNCDCGRFLEIGNSVFMEYVKKTDGTFAKLPKANVDFGGGLERIAAVLRQDPDIFKVDLLYKTIIRLEKLSGKSYEGGYQNSFRVIADHARAACFMISEGVMPSNVERGYLVRRLLRRAIRRGEILGLGEKNISCLAEQIAISYNKIYPELSEKLPFIRQVIDSEEEKFKKALAQGMRRFEKLISKKPSAISGREAFDLYQNFGFPLDIIKEISAEKGLRVDEKDFDLEMKNHQDLSRRTAEKKFKGGLADAGRETVKLHTAHHLLLAALKKVLGPDVKQRGSNITSVRLRLDFSFPSKMSQRQIKAVEDLVNRKIKENLRVVRKEMTKTEAEKIGAEMEFGSKYGQMVSVYFIQNDKGSVFSKEFCGGPHVNLTSELGKFKIIKEESCGAGVRRIKAILTTDN